MKTKMAYATAVLAMTIPVSAKAQIAYTGLTVVQFYDQNSPTTVGLNEALIGPDVNVFAPSDFTGATVSYPGAGSPQVLNYSPQLFVDGTYSNNNNIHSFPDIGALNAAYPFGTYSFTATNSATNASQSASLFYGSNDWPSAVAALSAASYSSLQAMNVAQSQVLNFNTFTGSGDRSTVLDIYNNANNSLVYDSGPLSNTLGSYTLPANTLTPGNSYTYSVSFNNVDHVPGSPGYYLFYQNNTFGMFTTALGLGGPQTLANFQGGTLGAPVGLPIVGQIGDITGSIGGVGSTDLYKFYWSGGAFDATMGLTGETPSSAYAFELTDQFGNVIQSTTLDQSDSWLATLQNNMGAGLYEVGLVANDPNDPSFNLAFNTPVQGVVPLAAGVPEPETWAMMIVGFGLLGMAMRRRKAKPVYERSTKAILGAV